MSDESPPEMPQSDTPAGKLPSSSFVVDWNLEPAALYASAASIDVAPDCVSLVFLDALPAERRIAVLDGERKMVARPVVSLRITRPFFYFILRELVRRWNTEIAKDHEALRVAEPMPLPPNEGSP